MPALTLVNAVLLPMADAAPGAPDWFVGWMRVDESGRISGIGPGSPPPEAADGPAATVVDAGGTIVAPGFVSAHSHLFTSGLRGIAPGSTLYPWLQAMSEVFRHADAEAMYWSTVHGALDFLACGITSAYNFTQSRVSWVFDPATARSTVGTVHPPEYLTRQFDGAADTGLRVMTAIRLDDEAAPEPQVLGTFADMVAACAERTPADQHLGASVFGAVQWAASPRTAEIEAQVMREHGIGNQSHFLETAQDVEVQRAKFAWYTDAGVLGPALLLGHFVHPTDEMVTAAAEAGCGMVWQATSNGRLGSGIADVVRFARAGMRIGMGLDDQSCTDQSDPFGNMRLGMYTMRALHTDASVLMPREVLRMHTLGSAEVLGVADRVGSLEIGKFADFVVVDHRAPGTGPVWDVYATYVMACGLRNLKQVYVGGALVSEDGRCTGPLAADVDDALHDRITRAARAAGMHPALDPARQVPDARP
ncbi:amidohydrolase family protein [Pseudonocardia xinjiangensis]|uniref:Amidohydrolase family protein n=1 Tax=Pseudonocardia xinjiangensis TaxID=75289 RepID=A0ABX1RCH0_9PSEU|nr:amidohydrolase family protein [Pseudonocardia xinjiangensis]NMH78075.1 amidohydrolase family protein [Pseudonocardia xinjiangensis]